MLTKLKPISNLAVAVIFVSAGFITTSLNAEESIIDKLQLAEGHKHKKGHHRKNMMKKMDTDGDGKVSRDEFMSHAEKKFARKDLNNDGFITEDEHGQCHRHKKEQTNTEA